MRVLAGGQLAVFQGGPERGNVSAGGAHRRLQSVVNFGETSCSLGRVENLACPDADPPIRRPADMFFLPLDFSNPVC
jgi:hypothetical protein